MLLQRLLLPTLSFSLFKQKSIGIPLQTTTVFTPSPPPSTRSPLLLIPTRSSLLGALFSSEAAVLEDDIDREDTDDYGAESEEKFVSETNNKNKELNHRLPNLSVKEKKELASYAHSLGKKLKSQQVGKSGVTHAVVTALVETLEANELLKLKIHNSCPGELDDVVKQLEEGTGSVVVGRIGRTLILYRPSLSKLKEEEEEKKRAQLLLKKKQPILKPFQSRSQAPKGSRQYGRGRRGSSRFSVSG